MLGLAQGVAIGFQCGEYFVKYCESHKTLSWIWIMLWWHNLCYIFYSRGESWQYETRFGIFKNIFNVFNWKSLKTSIREVLYGKSLLKTFPFYKLSSLSFCPSKYWPKIAHGSSPMQKENSSSTSFRVVGLRAQALPLSLNVLMLYGNMEQLAKLHMSIFTLLVSTEYSSELSIKKHKKHLKICWVN